MIASSRSSGLQPLRGVALASAMSVSNVSSPRAISLRRNLAGNIIGNGIYTASQFGMVTVLAKAGSTATVGALAFALLICNPLTYLLGLQLRTLLATDVRYKYSFAESARLRVWLAL